MGGVQPVVPRGQPRLPKTNRMVGKLTKLQDGIPVTMKVIDHGSQRFEDEYRKNEVVVVV